MSQFARPSGTTLDSSMTQQGAATLHECLNDQSDSTYITSGTSSADGYGPLDDLVAPPVNTGHILRFRNTGASGTGAVHIYLYQGNPGGSGTVIKDVTHDEVSGWHDQEVTLSEAEAANITDYTDLHWRYQGGPGGPGPMSWQSAGYELEIPDAEQTELYGIASETDSALAFTHSKEAQYGVATETDAALSLSAEKLETYGIAAEADSALSFAVALGPYGGVILGDHPVGYWRLEEASGNAIDAIFGEALSAIGTPGYQATGLVGFAVDFSGDDAFAADSATDYAIGTGTIEAWVKTTTPGAGYRAVITKQTAYGIFLQDSIAGVYDWSANAFRSSAINVADGEWHHLALTFDSGVLNGSHFYVDGVDQWTGTYTIAAQTVRMDLSDGNAGQRINGIIDEAAIYDSVLTPAQILQHYQAGVGQFAEYGVALEIDTALPYEIPQTVIYEVALESDFALSFTARIVGPPGVSFPMGSIHSPFLLKPIRRREHR